MLSLLMAFPEDVEATKEKVYWKLLKGIESQVFQVRLILSQALLPLADCNGGDNEFKPYQIPYDFYSAGVSCSTC